MAKNGYNCLMLYLKMQIEAVLKVIHKFCTFVGGYKPFNKQHIELRQGGQTTARGPHLSSQPFQSGQPNTLHIFSSTTFQTVDSSVTALAAACHVNHTVPVPSVARQS